MNKTLLTFIAIILFNANSIAQSSWSQWDPIYSGNRTNCMFSYKISSQAFTKDCEQGYSYYRIYNNMTCIGSYLKFKFDYVDCNNMTQTESVVIELDFKGASESSGKWFTGKKVTRVYAVKFED